MKLVPVLLRQSFTVAVAAALAATAAFARPVTLARGGQSLVDIVVADDASATAREAATDLQSYIERIAGVSPVVRGESAPATAAAIAIFVGVTKAAVAAGIDPNRLEPEGFAIRARGEQIHIVGSSRTSDDPGTRHGVLSFIERELGVRWLWPGELGTVIPRRDPLVISVTERTEKPFMRIRIVRDGINNLNPAKLVKGMKLLGMEESRRANMGQQSREWSRHQKLGGNVRASYGHAFSDWWEKYHRDHPDYFAMMPDGRRNQPFPSTHRVKICVSNPAVQDQWVANARTYFAANPKSISVSASPNDNVYDGHCRCEDCENWDDPRGEKYVMRWVAGGREVKAEHVSLTDRYVRFYNIVADRLAKEYPDKYVGAYAYGTWLNPPIREREIRDNILMGYVSISNITISEEEWDKDFARWNGWAEVVENLFFRPNLLWGGHGMPLVYVHRLASDLRHRADTGMMGADFDALLHHWSTHGLNYYVLAKLLWDPYLDVDALIDDYARAAFGPAADEMKRYYSALEAHTTALRKNMPPVTNRANDILPMIPRFYTPRVIGEWRQRLDEALAYVPAGSDYARRIEWMKLGVEYAEIQSRLLSLATKENRSKADRAQIAQLADEQESWYKAHLYDWSLCPPLLRYREPDALFGRTGNADPKDID